MNRSRRLVAALGERHTVIMCGTLHLEYNVQRPAALGDVICSDSQARVRRRQFTSCLRLGTTGATRGVSLVSFCTHLTPGVPDMGNWVWATSFRAPLVWNCGCVDRQCFTALLWFALMIATVCALAWPYGRIFDSRASSSWKLGNGTLVPRRVRCVVWFHRRKRKV